MEREILPQIDVDTRSFCLKSICVNQRPIERLKSAGGCNLRISSEAMCAAAIFSYSLGNALLGTNKKVSLIKIK